MKLYINLPINPRIVIIIVTYNAERYAKQLAESIVNQDYDLDKVLVVVVDNASADNSIEIFRNVFLRANIGYVIAKLGHNLGFSIANNIAIWMVKKIYSDISDKIFILLNPDTYIINRKFLKTAEKLTATLPIVGFATISGEHNTVIDGLGSYIDFLGNCSDILCCVKKTPYIDYFLEKLPLIYPVPATCFAAVAINGNTIAKLGVLRNEYVIYFEDTEYSLRAWSNGVPVHVYRKFMVWHARGGTQKQHSMQQCTRPSISVKHHFTKNMILLTYEYLGPLRFVLRLALYSLIYTLRRDKETMLAIVTALRLIRRKRIRVRKLPRGLVKRNPKNSIILYAVRYKLRFPHSSIEEAMRYGAIRLSIIGLIRAVGLRLSPRIRVEHRSL